MSIYELHSLLLLSLTYPANLLVYFFLFLYTVQGHQFFSYRFLLYTVQGHQFFSYRFLLRIWNGGV